MTKRLISFGLWGDNRVYLEGAVANARLAPSVYPGWTCRFYANKRVPVIGQLRGLGCEVVETDDELDWRQLAASDTAAEYIIFRDVDSRLGQREAKLVAAWIKSGQIAHVVYPELFRRFAARHSKPLLLGGLWGVKGGVLPHVAERLRVWHEPHEAFVKNHDFKFANEFILPHVIHDLRIDENDDPLMGSRVVPESCKRPIQRLKGSAFCRSRAHCSNCRNLAKVRDALIAQLVVPNAAGSDFPCPEGFDVNNLPRRKRRRFRRSRSKLPAFVAGRVSECNTCDNTDCRLKHCTKDCEITNILKRKNFHCPLSKF